MLKERPEAATTQKTENVTPLSVRVLPSDFP